MKNIEVGLLSELLRDSKRSDRDLAKLLKVSQPTITRVRHRLVKDGLIRQFTIIPDFAKLGFEIFAISCFKSKVKEESTEKARKVTMSKPNIVLAAECDGMGMNVVLVSLHKNYSDYVNFMRELRLEGGTDLENSSSLIVSLNGTVVKPFSLKYLAETLEK
jgi:DNA-binding Lrp family transcriptional regulator